MFILASIVGRSFDNLNDCFGLILLFEITFNFIVVIMIIMSYIIKVQAVTWQSSCYLIGELIKNLASLILICSFSEKIRNKVRYTVSSSALIPKVISYLNTGKESGTYSSNT